MKLCLNARVFLKKHLFFLYTCLAHFPSQWFGGIPRCCGIFVDTEQQLSTHDPRKDIPRWSYHLILVLFNYVIMFFESFILAIPKLKKKKKRKRKKRTNEIRNYQQVIQCRRLDWCIFSRYISCLFLWSPSRVSHRHTFICTNAPQAFLTLF